MNIFIVFKAHKWYNIYGDVFVKKNILEILTQQKNMNLKGNLYHLTQIQFAYNSNHIEGSKLTEDETRLMYETNTLFTEESKSVNIDDIIEMANHFYLFDYMLAKSKEVLSEELIKEFHRILKRGTTDERIEWFNVGDYKKLPNEVGGTSTTKPENVEKDIKNLLTWYNSLVNVTFADVLEFHYEFETIHPFQDGNGRIGRIIMFKECLKNNITPFIVLDEFKAFYYRGLKEFKKEQGFLKDTCLTMQDRYKELIDRLIK